jgi:putative ABC transport system permease protein
MPLSDGARSRARPCVEAHHRAGIRLALIGVVVGIGVALLLTRLIRQLLFGVGTIDLPTYGVIAAALIIIALLACWVPAQRATRVDPMVGQRCE